MGVVVLNDLRQRCFSDFLDGSIPLLRPFISKSSVVALTETFQSGWIGEGERTYELEGRVRDVVGLKRAVAVNSGTAALNLLLDLLNLGPQNTIITSPYTCSASIQPILRRGIKIFFADVLLDGTLCPNSVRKAANKLQSVDAIMAIDLNGNSCRHAELREIARDSSAFYIVDGAQSFGSDLPEGYLSKYVDFYFTSFQSVKSLTSVDGGCLFLNDDELAERAIRKRWFGIDRREKHQSKMPSRYDIEEFGDKWHLNDVCATIAIENLAYLEKLIAHQREVAKQYQEALEGQSGLELFKSEHSTNWLFPIALTGFRDQLIEAAARERVELSPVHQDCRLLAPVASSDLVDQVENLVNVEYLQDNLVCLPTGWWIDSEAVQRVVEVIRRFGEGRV